MKLLTKQLVKRFEKVGRQEGAAEPTVICKFFNPCGRSTWYATEYDPVSEMFFGYVSLCGDYTDEWGYFSLDELQAYRGPFGVGIERDLYFDERPISKVIK